MAEQIKFDLSKHWQPTKANYFNRIKKGKLIEILKDLKGDEFALSQADAKKGDLAVDELIKNGIKAVTWAGALTLFGDLAHDLFALAKALLAHF